MKYGNSVFGPFILITSSLAASEFRLDSDFVPKEALCLRPVYRTRITPDMCEPQEWDRVVGGVQAYA